MSDKKTLEQIRDEYAEATADNHMAKKKPMAKAKPKPAPKKK